MNYQRTQNDHLEEAHEPQGHTDRKTNGVRRPLQQQSGKYEITENNQQTLWS